MTLKRVVADFTHGGQTFSTGEVGEFSDSHIVELTAAGHIDHDPQLLSWALSHGKVKKANYAKPFKLPAPE